MSITFKKWCICKKIFNRKWNFERHIENCKIAKKSTPLELLTFGEINKLNVNVCEHYRIRDICKECTTKNCPHKNRKDTCKECGGSQICIHEKRKKTCIICSPEIACNNCKEMIMSTNKKYKPNCFRCYCVLNPDIEIKQRYKTKEFLLTEALKEMNLGVNFIQDKHVGGCSKKRPDFI